MRRKRWIAVLGVLGFVALWLLLQNQSLSFRTLKEAQTAVESVGCFVVPDRKNGPPVSSMVVSRAPIAWTDANSLRKQGPRTQEWKGKAWIVTPSRVVELNTSPNDEPPRQWGKLWVFGDDDFITELEGKLNRRSFLCL